MHSYFGYGLNIQSVVPLPELLSTTGAKADVVINLGTVTYPKPHVGGEREYCSMSADEAFLYWEDFGTFLVRQGKEIIIDPRCNVDDGVLRLPLLGAGLAVLLHQRGIYVMHASAIAVDGGAVVFLGPKGHGKSSMAAAFYASGHGLLADDLVAVDLSDPTTPMVIPAFPQLKLWPEAAAFVLNDNPDDLAWLAPGYEKRSRFASKGFTSQPLPLRCMYVLSEGDEVEISRLSPQKAIAELIGNSYIARFGRNALHGTAAATHLQRSVDLVNQLPLYRLARPDSLQLLPTIVKVIKTHAADALVDK